jgi:hypothetical protein
MTRTSVEFFATAREQREWLIEVLTDSVIWALTESVTPGQFERLSVATLSELSFAGREYTTRVFIGRADLSEEPLFETRPGRLELDFAKSRAVQFVPSTETGDTIIEGSLAILHEADYRRIGVDPGPLLGWFGLLSKSLEAMIVKDRVHLVTLAPGELPARSRRRVLISPGVIQLHKNGHRLKQFLNSKIEFGIEE